MNISQLMADPEAAAIFAAIPATMAPGDIADNFILARLDRDKPRQKAFEYHAGLLATQHFERADVRECLARVEAYGKRAVPGKGGDADSERIARKIETLAATGDYQVIEGRAVFQISDTMRVKCLNTPACIAWLVAKYRGGFPKPKSLARMRSDMRR